MSAAKFDYFTKMQFYNRSWDRTCTWDEPHPEHMPFPYDIITCILMVFIAFWICGNDGF